MFYLHTFIDYKYLLYSLYFEVTYDTVVIMHACYIYSKIYTIILYTCMLHLQFTYFYYTY